MPSITVDELLAVRPEAIEDVEIDGFSGTVFRLKTWTAGQRMGLERVTMKAQETNDYRLLASLKLRSIAMSLVDDAGALMFGDANMDENVKKLSAMDAGLAEELFAHVTRINKMDTEAGSEEEKK
jgi:hypothetical protein